MGTSLKVAPVSSIPDMVAPGTARALFNMEVVGSFSEEHGDTVVLGSCDDSCIELARLLGWGDELEALMEAEAGSGSMGSEAGAGAANPGGVETGEPVPREHDHRAGDRAGDGDNDRDIGRGRDRDGDGEFFLI